MTGGPDQDLDPATPLFHRVGETTFEPTILTTGPWRPDAMHGGPPGALIGQCVEHALAPDERVARIGIDLERPVPLVPLEVRVQRRTSSRRVATLHIALMAGDERVVAGRALLLRGEAIPEPVWTGDESPPDLPPAPVAGSVPDPMHGGPIAYHRDAVEHRFVSGGFAVPGPAVSWIRLTRPLIAGEPTTGLAALFAAADFGSPISQSLPRDVGVGFINVDVTVALSGVPTGPWIWLDAVGSVHPDGFGLATTRIGDASGQVGVVTQAQLAMPLPG